MLVLYCREIGLCPPSKWYTPHKWGDSQFSGGWRAEANPQVEWDKIPTHPQLEKLVILSHFGGMWPSIALPHPTHNWIGSLIPFWWYGAFRRASAPQPSPDWESPHVWGVSHVHGGQRPTISDT